MSDNETATVTDVVTQIDCVIDLLKEERERGEFYMELDPAVLQELASPLAKPRRTVVAEPAAPVRAATPAVSAPPPSTPRFRPRKKEEKKEPAMAAKTGVSADAKLPESLDELTQLISVCKKCPLHQWRNKTVPGIGSTTPDIMFIGEGPGKDEDAQGEPFVGRAGQVLTRLITKMGYAREEVFIGNIVKCRPTVNNEGTRDRPPTPEEMEGCIPYLKKQIEILKPKALVLLGNTALQGLFGYKGITKHRGKWLVFEGIDAMPTFHPSYLLRNGGNNSKPFWQVWEDMSQVLEKLGRPVPETKKQPEQPGLNL